MQIRILSSARADFQRQFRYLQDAYVGDETLDKFLEEVDQACLKIHKNPRTWSFVPGSRRVRRVQISRFRMQVFYLIRKDGAPVILEFAGPGVQPRWVDRL